METMTTHELAKQLLSFDDKKVVVGSDYGDRIRTIQAIAITELGEAFLTDTSYSDSGYKVVEDVDVDDDSEEVVILNFDIL